MMFCGVPYLLGYLLLSYAHFVPTPAAFKALLLAGRLLAGFGMGWASAVAPVSLPRERMAEQMAWCNCSRVSCDM
jgi:hypothetical protein